MATGPSFPSATNVFPLSWDESGRITVGFSRNPKTFKYNRYVSYGFTKKNRGLYLKWNNQAQARMLNANAYLWAYGQDRPVPANPEGFTWLPYALERRDYAYGHDLDTIDMADFKLMQVDREGHAQLAATCRAKRIIDTLTTTASWGTAVDPDLTQNHTNTATVAAGGKFDVGTSTNPYFMAGIDYAMDQITLDTNGKLGASPGRMVIVMNPTDARRIAKSAEMKDFLKGSPYALPSITGSIFEQNLYGLPPIFQGAEVVVDDTVRVSSEVGAAALTREYLWPSGTIGVFFKPDQLDGAYGEKPFSTMTVFYRAAGESSQSIDSTGIDLTVTEFQDTRNRRWEGHVTEETDEILTAPAAGWLFTSATN